MSRTGPSRLGLTAAIVASLFALTSCTRAHSDATAFVPSQAALPLIAATNGPAETKKESVLQQLKELQAPAGAPVPAFDPAQFGTDLPSVAKTRCNAFNYVLQRDLIDIDYSSQRTCGIRSGALFDQSTATWAWYVNGEPTNAVGVDNLVSLADAWANGASTWPADRRETFRNDPANLVAASTASIASKAGRSAALWLPPAVGDRCNYIAQQIAVKLDFALTVTSAERAAMTTVLNGCPDTFITPKPTSAPPTAGSPSPSVSPTKTKKPTPTPTKKTVKPKPIKPKPKPKPSPTKTATPKPTPTVTITATVTATPSP
jgi:hypothetical protein